MLLQGTRLFVGIHRVRALDAGNRRASQPAPRRKHHAIVTQPDFTARGLHGHRPRRCIDARHIAVDALHIDWTEHIVQRNADIREVVLVEARPNSVPRAATDERYPKPLVRAAVAQSRCRNCCPHSGESAADNHQLVHARAHHVFGPTHSAHAYETKPHVDL